MRGKVAAGLQQPAGDQGEDQGAEKGGQAFRLAQQRALLSCSNVPGLDPQVLARREGEGGGTRVETLGPSWREEWEWNVEAQVLMPTQVS